MQFTKCKNKAEKRTLQNLWYFVKVYGTNCPQDITFNSRA
jgi:hypothetical protein